MKIFVATDINIVLCEGKILAYGKYSTILRRYYNAFGPIVLCARFNVIDNVEKGLHDISDIVDSTVNMGSLYKMFLNKCNKEIESAMADCDLVIGRCPSIAAYKAGDVARKLGKPYYAESMGCAWDAYWNHSIVGKVIAPYMFFKMKDIVYNADYALYVTNEFLQNRYPCKNESVAASNVLIESVDEEILNKRLDKIANTEYKNITLMTTAAIDVKYKGQEFVIKAIPELNKLGIQVKYLVVGEGDATYLKGIAKSCGVEEQVEFTGRRTLDEVFSLIDQTDIYIQPSLQEGLPRSVIEAMSRACPVIGAKTAGIPELISHECVVKRKSISGIAETIRKITNTEKMTELAKQNFAHSKEYLNDVLNTRRNEYFSYVVSNLEEGKSIKVKD